MGAMLRKENAVLRTLLVSRVLGAVRMTVIAVEILYVEDPIASSLDLSSTKMIIVV